MLLLNIECRDANLSAGVVVGVYEQQLLPAKFGCFTPTAALQPWG
jgi:hypothetical protein